MTEIDPAELDARLTIIEEAFQNESGNGEESPIVSVPNILTRLVNLENRLSIPRAWEERLEDLETKQNEFESATWVREHEIAKEAGTADDTAHRESSREQADKAVALSEIRQGVQLDEIRTRLNTIGKELSNLSSVTLIVIGVAALILAVLVNIGWQAFV